MNGVRDQGDRSGKGAWSQWYARTVGRVAARYGLPARRLLWPIPWKAPYRRKHLALAREGGLGDVLMCTPALRELKRRNPRCHVAFFTRCPEVLTDSPYVDEIGAWVDQPPDSVQLAYENSLPPWRHIACILADHLGLRASDVRPRYTLQQSLVERFQKEWRGLPRPWITVHRRAGPWTPNKDWPETLWDETIAELCRRGTIIEIGSNPPASRGPRSSYVDLTGTTSLAELAAAVAAADVHVGPVSAPVHLAAAVGTPSVVIYGGYEHPVCSSYPGNINLYSPVPCSPCWLTTPCPYEKKCLSAIAPATMLAAVAQLANAKRRTDNS